MKRLCLIMSLALLLGGCSAIDELIKGRDPEVITEHRYLAFRDVLIPGGMSEAESDIENGQGRLVLSGRIEGLSLLRFFNSSMVSDGWSLVKKIQYNGAVKLFFEKEGAIASINISENPVTTRVEIWYVRKP